MAELRVRNRKQLADCAKPFDDNDNYKKVLRFGDAKTKEEILGYLTCIKERNENIRLTTIYNNAKNTMDAANTKESFATAAEMFASISGFKDANKLAQQCLDKAVICRKDEIYALARVGMTGEKVEAYDNAIKTFHTIPGWRDADAQINACQKKIEEIKAKEEADRLAVERKAEEQSIAAEKEAEEHRIAAKKEIKKCVIAAFVTIACIAIITLLYTTMIIPNNKYKESLALIDDGRITYAFEKLVALNNYKDSAEKANQIFNQYKTEKIQKLEVGDTIFFGTYEQDNNISNGKEFIKWTVLAKENGKALLISKYALDTKKYNTLYTDVTWETCSLRTWMNDTFLNDAFSADEQKTIAMTTVNADKNPMYITDAGIATNDKLFLLSSTEVEKYFTTDESRKCAQTAYAKAQGWWHSREKYKTTTGEKSCWWWLRSYDSYHACVNTVSNEGSVNNFQSVTFGGHGVRPALWLNLES